jgi:lipopolysaccharide transport system permease protein
MTEEGSSSVTVEWEHRTAGGIEYGGPSPKGVPPGMLASLPRALRTIWTSRRLIWLLATHDYKANFRAQSLGMFWAILNPLITMLTLTMAFMYILRIPIPNFPIFYLSGAVAWNFFIQTLLGSSGAFQSRANLIRRTNFPRYLIPLISLTTQFIAFTVEFGLLYALYFAFPDAYRFGPELLFLPVLLALLILLGTGTGLLAASLNVRFRDVSYVVSAIATLGFWVTPIIYETTMAPDWIVPWFNLNPLAGIVEGMRSIIMHGRIPDLGSLLPAVIASVLFLVLGAAAYRRENLQMADYL